MEVDGLNARGRSDRGAGDVRESQKEVRIREKIWGEHGRLLSKMDTKVTLALPRAVLDLEGGYLLPSAS